jgi:hypothetical protein
MIQVLATNHKHAAAHRRARFDFRDSTEAQPRERHRELFDMLRPPIINRFHPDWFALRIWEDDGGGGQVQLS